MLLLAVLLYATGDVQSTGDMKCTGTVIVSFSMLWLLLVIASLIDINIGFRVIFGQWL